ncbi:uncharacterized protein LOC121795463 [Salvia splendens]|uniref:uncharacterized protein LOC121795463 n=1 Tax=Salvia splendens TaxID=180675 RepID=UPI001C279B17|nr:uncharacterized protein LOC121795463 [Salvia splendens]XP_042049935.1 uncharacterized protein LOC121795463 [Salvia splendens]XP_042049936.1 uncharacterized protein LOC121795463 [Salvia splendens]
MGETLVVDSNVSEVVGGAEAQIGEKDVREGETPEKSEGTETPVYISGATPLLNKEGEALDAENAQEPVDVGLNLLVHLTGDTNSPVNPREERRQARRSLLDKIYETVPQTEEGLLSLETAAPEHANSPRPTDGGSDEDERRHAAERKRKGKQIAPSSTKKAKGKSADHSPSPPAEVPSDVKSENPNESSDSEEEQEVELNFEPKEIWITKELLNAMGKFEDPKRTAIYAEKSVVGKYAKSGKMYDSAELKGISSNDEFRGYIGAIGFDWLLKHSTIEVPIDVAREFFSTFRFKSTTDLDADSINFRLFNEEHVMSIREWTLRMGLLMRTEDDEGLWNERMVGPPKLTPGFKAQSAWEFLTHPRVGQFKTSCSKAHHIEDRVLRFAQTFISYNLMGTANTALTTADLYFTWCMATGVRVHLGYWLAQACHQVTANPSRHLHTCHLLGAYLQRNVIMKIHKACREVKMCLPPEVFNMEYFFNKGLLIKHKRDVCFYEVGKSEAQIKQEQEVAGVKDVTDVGEARKPVVEVDAMRKEVSWMRSEIQKVMEGIVALRGKGKDSGEAERVRKEVARVRTEMEGMRTEVRKVREEIVALKGRVSDLVVMSSRCTEKMTEGVALMMTMMKWLR